MPSHGPSATAEDSSRTLVKILSRIRPPRFPRRNFSVVRFGAMGDGRQDSRPGFARAISSCHREGGGHVNVPPGNYLVNGPLHLLSNVDLHLARGATIRFGTNPEDYLPPVEVRWEGTRCYSYSPLVYAFRQRNVAVTGHGTLDGQARAFWGTWKSKQARDQHALRTMGMQATPLERRVFGAGHYLRPSLFEPHECRNVLVGGVTFRGSPFWTVHPVFCTNVTVRGVRVLGGTTNDDACDPDSCRDVLIEDCHFDTVDDHVAINAGRDRDAWSLPGCENVIVRRCASGRSRASAFAIGSQMSGSVRNVFIQDCTVREVRENALYVKSNSDRGGTVENVWVQRVRVGSCGSLVMLQTDYKRVRGHAYPPTFRNLHFEALRCRTATRFGIYSAGTIRRPIHSVALWNIRIDQARTGIRVRFTRSVDARNLRVNGQEIALGKGRRQSPGSRVRALET